MEQFKIVHIIAGLNPGGAEMMLTKLTQSVAKEQFHFHIISLSDEGELGPLLKEAGAEVHTLGMSSRSFHFRDFWKLVKLLRQLKPNLIQSWMYHADLINSLASYFLQKTPVIWGLRQSLLTPGFLKPKTRFLAKVCAKLSGTPANIICCSESTLKAHVEFGYRSKNMIVIPNGFDLNQFKPDQGSRKKIRTELNIAEGDILFGMVSRFDRYKDHENLIRASKRVIEIYPNAYFLLCGTDISPQNKILVKWLNQSNVRDNFFLLDQRSDIPRITAALDFSVLCSHSEGFPNVVGEAMACAVPCIVTDVGDSANIVGDTGIVVPPKEKALMTNALLEMASLTKEQKLILGTRARKRIEQLYSLSVITEKYESTYRKAILGRKSSC
ncbi:MAG: hypothetical protein COB67_04275 [SAR324 cluster bacterium]|uniref:Glycosyltransferase n=1 Tax=SAR324 cluster bacterium TaxID=2024889 RepID=A0A2A4T6W7_9DELT|nr:MAG: hypothetical protein COB67_04275 [SAR324 cluster bacterium]